MTKNIDARGLACPQPVLLTKQAVDNDRPSRLTVQVDNEAAVENVSRFLETRGYAPVSTGQGGSFTISGVDTSNSERQNDAARDVETMTAVPGSDHREEARKIMVFITSDRVGSGDDELGEKLMISFINTLSEMGDELWRIVFVNNGVKLTIAGSPVLETLLEYEKQNVSIWVCGTCLTHFDLLDKKQVGDTTNMLDIVTAMQLADQTITL